MKIYSFRIEKKKKNNYSQRTILEQFSVQILQVEKGNKAVYVADY